MKKLVVLTGAGISAESGISTFRDSGGLWEGHDVNEVATPEGFAANPTLVLDFYNQRRRQLLEVQPNEAHRWHTSRSAFTWSSSPRMWMTYTSVRVATM